jgi:zinc transport system substrate-binding protein
VEQPKRPMARFFVPMVVLCLAVLDARAADRLVVYTVNYPLQYFAERIAGGRADVHFPAPAGADPASWKPDRRTIGEYRSADLILLNGAGYAQWLDRASLPRHRLVNTSAAFADGYIAADAGLARSHGAGSDRSPAGTASTTWLDFHQASGQARAVLAALTEKRPQHRAEFERNNAALEQDLMGLDLELQRLLGRYPGKPLFVSSPVYQYLARRYGLRLESVNWKPDTMAPEPEWQKLALAQERFPATWMLWEAQPRADIVERLEAAGIMPVVYSPCANRPSQGDFMSVMKGNVESLKRIFGAD